MRTDYAGLYYTGDKKDYTGFVDYYVEDFGEYCLCKNS